MAKTTASVGQFMTVQPHSIGADQTLARAKTVMQEHHVRHLPVLHGGRLVGIVSQRDVALVETLEDVDPRLVTVSDAMSTSVYSVAPETPLQQVVKEMARRRYGSAVVMRGHKVAGIFTTVDACRALASLLQEQPTT